MAICKVNFQNPRQVGTNTKRGRCAVAFVVLAGRTNWWPAPLIGGVVWLILMLLVVLWPFGGKRLGHR